jgi:hypothetical protein
MGKRSTYEKRPRDYYVTPIKAVEPLVGHLPQGFSYCEPCAGNGALILHLETLFNAFCFVPKDIEPQADWIIQGDALNLQGPELEYCEWIVTNPPFTWSILKPLMDKFISLRKTVLLLPADYMHNIRMKKYMDMCERVVSIGRVKWIEDSKVAGVDNYVWMFFDKDHVGPTKFYGRTQ